MIKRQCFWVLGCCIFLMTIFSGCAGTASGVGQSTNSAIQWHAIRHPHLPSGINTMDSARNDLKNIMENPEEENLGAEFGIDYFFQYSLAGLSSTEAGRQKILEGMAADKDTIIGPFFSGPYLMINNIESIAVLEDRLQVSSLLVIPYADLSCWPITYDSDTVFLGGKDNLKLFIFPKDPNAREAKRVADVKKVERIANDLFFIQQQFKTCPFHPQETAAQFEARAKEYREQTVKPSISEEQRKYVVQANLLTGQKNYWGAAQENYYQWAIDQMKRYLLLVPDAKDARSAQDKIYEWELQMKK
jgi:hypothetical protein